ncbi:MAG: hypothetical protein ABIW83_01105 [Allosphingosinicella sp.]
MPTTAQDRVRRGPFAALLILLSLLLSSGIDAAAGNDFRSPLARLAPSRNGAGTAVLLSGTRNPSDDESIGPEGGPFLAPSEPVPVTDLLWARPLADSQRGDRVPGPRPATASYRARAPPAA